MMSPRTRKAPRANSWSFRSVLNLHQLAQDLVPLNPLSALERQDERVVRFRGSQAVDARHAGDDDDIAPLEKGPRRGQPQPVDLVVDDGFLLDVGVRRRHVRFGLVVVVVADEELHGIPRKESTELLIQLRRERLVVHHHQRGPIHAREDLRHREGLAGPGDTEQDLGPVAALKPFDQLRNGRGLVTPKLEVAFELERRGRRNRRPFHPVTSCASPPQTRLRALPRSSRGGLAPSAP